MAGIEVGAFNVADKHKKQLQELIMVDLRASDVVCGWIVITCLHEHHPFCPRAVVRALCWLSN